jgi:hypothetical protein
MIDIILSITTFIVWITILPIHGWQGYVLPLLIGFSLGRLLAYGMRDR